MSDCIVKKSKKELCMVCLKNRVIINGTGILVPALYGNPGFYLYQCDSIIGEILRYSPKNLQWTKITTKKARTLAQGIFWDHQDIKVFNNSPLQWVRGFSGYHFICEDCINTKEYQEYLDSQSQILIENEIKKLCKERDSIRVEERKIQERLMKNSDRLFRLQRL